MFCFSCSHSPCCRNISPVYRSGRLGWRCRRTRSPSLQHRCSSCRKVHGRESEIYHAKMEKRFLSCSKKNLKFMQIFLLYLPVNAHCFFGDFFQVSEPHRHRKLAAGRSSRRVKDELKSKPINSRYLMNSRDLINLPGGFKWEFIVVFIKGGDKFRERSVLRSQEVEHIKCCFPG